MAAKDLGMPWSLKELGYCAESFSTAQQNLALSVPDWTVRLALNLMMDHSISCVVYPLV
jgi:hypothetical protein